VKSALTLPPCSARLPPSLEGEEKNEIALSYFPGVNQGPV